VLASRQRRSGGSKKRPQRNEVKDVKAKKPKPIREESFPAESVFQANDLSYIDSIVDPNRAHRAGPKGYPPGAMFMAILLMYLKEIKSILDLVRFLDANPGWLRTLGLKRRVHGVETYSVPDRTRFYRFARRVGIDGMMDILSVMVVRLMKQGIIRGKSVSLDATIISAWFKDDRSKKDERHMKVCRHEKSKDRDASWGYDHHRNKYVYGYKVHVLLDSETALPIALTITAAGFGENRTVGWFVAMILKLGIPVRKFFADAGYDSYATRMMMIEKLKAIPFIPFNVKASKGETREEKVARCRQLHYRWYVKNFLRSWWIDPSSKRFDREFDARTFSEQVFSVGKGSLNLNSLMHRGREWATLHSVVVCMVMLAVAKTATEQGRPDLIRCVRNFAA
jgi:hypothetical protein